MTVTFISLVDDSIAILITAVQWRDMCIHEPLEVYSRKVGVPLPLDGFKLTLSPVSIILRINSSSGGLMAESIFLL